MIKQRLGTLVFFCGKMGAGKSTMAKQIATDRHAVLLSEDEWLADLFPNKISTLADYVACAQQLKRPIKKLVQSVLQTGTDVVMDFPANTRSQRAWFQEIFAAVGAEHELVYIDLPDETCLRQIAKRREQQPERAHTDTPEMFKQVTKYFVAPLPDEGFHVCRKETR